LGLIQLGGKALPKKLSMCFEKPRRKKHLKKKAESN
jgi:hypothetical protein